MLYEVITKNAGWKEESARNHFESLSPFFEIGDAVEFLVVEANRLRKRYPKILVAPLYFNVDTGKISQIQPE